MTPHERHAQEGHKTSFCSPNGLDKIEECEECGMRFFWAATEDHPITLRPKPSWIRKGDTQ